MSDYTIFDKAITKYDSNTANYECNHEDTQLEKGVFVCINCGIETGRAIMHEKEWRYYGPHDTKRSSDPNRVQIRKTEERNIYKDVANLGFSQKIISIANKLYSDVTQGQIFRGKSRKAIIFACIFHAYKLEGKPQTHEKLIKIFSLTRKIGLKGLKHVNLNAPKESPIHTTYITPVHLIEDIMSHFSSSKIQNAEVVDLYKKTKNKSSDLNRARPQSVAAGLIFYWIKSKGLDISLKDFAAKAELSELTINKITKEIERVLK